jgi:FMN-dependent NADH-azoreductase
LLHLDAGANRSTESITRELTALFADAWRTAHGDTGYRHRDLVADPVPPLDTPFCALGRRVERHGPVPPDEVAALVECPAEAREWALTRPLIDELLAADTVLIGAPMYNYSVPAALKAWIDRVTFPGAFTDRRTGRNTLLRGTNVVVVTARGGFGADTDFQTPYLRAYFGRLGVTDVRFIAAERTLAGLVPRLADQRPLAERSLAAARAEVVSLPVSSRDRPTLRPVR